MHLGRRRNIFTLGDERQRLQAKRENADLFERDPFKIQSYNFRYADRPTFPVQNVVNRSTPGTGAKPFETYYVNYNFTPPAHERENTTSNNFHENRRRKFLQDQRITPHRSLHNSSRFDRTRPANRNSQEECYVQELRNTTSNAINITTRGGSADRDGSRRLATTSTMSGRSTTHANSPYLRSVCNRDYLRNPNRTNYDTTAIFNQTHRSPPRSSQAQRVSLSTTRNNASQSSPNISAPKSRRLLYENSGRPEIGINVGTTRAYSVDRSTQPTINMHTPNSIYNRGVVVSAGQTNGPNTRSGCQININIKNLDDNDAEGENLTINIEADDSSDNDENVLANNCQIEDNRQNNIFRENIERIPNNHTTIATTPYSTDTNISNNRLPQFNTPPRAYSTGNIRVASIHSIRNMYDQNQDPPKYSEIRPLPAQVNRYTSRERLPAIIPANVGNVRSCFLRDNTTTSSRPTLTPATKRNKTPTRSTQTIQRPKNLVQTIPEPKKSCLKHPTTTNSKQIERKLSNIVSNQNNLSRTSHVNLTASQHQSMRNNAGRASTSSIQTRRSQSQVGATRRTSSPIVIHSSAQISKSPVNVNINVYADKLKLLRV